MLPRRNARRLKSMTYLPLFDLVHVASCSNWVELHFAHAAKAVTSPNDFGFTRGARHYHDIHRLYRTQKDFGSNAQGISHGGNPNQGIRLRHDPSTINRHCSSRHTHLHTSTEAPHYSIRKTPIRLNMPKPSITSGLPNRNKTTRCGGLASAFSIRRTSLREVAPTFLRQVGIISAGIHEL